MTTPTRIEDLLNLISDEPTVKTASQTAPQDQNPYEERLRQAIRGVTDPSVKTASQAGDPAQELMKIAQEAAAIDREAEIKHASLVATAMADAFVARMAQYDNAGNALQKNAGYLPELTIEAQLSKFASEQPEIFNAVASQGYRDASDLMDKIGQEVYAQAYDNEVVRIHKEAQQQFLNGYSATYAVLQRA